MVGNIDSRTQSQKARIGWCASWMGERDAQGDKMGDWALWVDHQTFKCRWDGRVSNTLNFQNRK